MPGRLKRAEAIREVTKLLWHNGNGSQVKIRGGIQMDENTLTHTKWNCIYHIVFIPKYRRKSMYGSSRDTRQKDKYLCCYAVLKQNSLQSVWNKSGTNTYSIAITIIIPFFYWSDFSLLKKSSELDECHSLDKYWPLLPKCPITDFMETIKMQWSQHG